MGLPKRQVAGDILVSGSGPFLYCNRALWNLSERVPPGPSGRFILAGLGIPDGWRERASLVLFLAPGM